MKRCECESEQWAWFWPISGKPKIYCEACDTEYDFELVLDSYLQLIQTRWKKVKKFK